MRATNFRNYRTDLNFGLCQGFFFCLIAQNLAAGSERVDPRSVDVGNLVPTAREPQEGMFLPRAGHL